MRNKKYPAFNKYKTIKEWAESEICKEKCITYECLYNRIVKLGWKTRRAVTTPLPKKKVFEAFGEEKSINEWSKSEICKNAGLSYSDLFNRLVTLGWSVEIALTKKIWEAPYGKYTGESKG